MEKIVQVRLNDDYINKLKFIKKFISDVCFQKEEEISTSFLLKYCINSTYHGDDITYYKEKIYKEKGQ